MLTIFIPALAAVLVAVLAQFLASRANRRAEERTAWRSLQQGVLIETQDELVKLWGAGAMALRGLADEARFTPIEESTARLTALWARMDDRNLAEAVSTWQSDLGEALAEVVGKRTPHTAQQITNRNKPFNEIMKRLGKAVIDCRPSSK